MKSGRLISGETIAQAIERTKGRSRGFDYLRIVLSVGVLAWHSTGVSYRGFVGPLLLRATASLILPMFFALSGFLISGSLLRVRSVSEFATLRAIRIVPALAVETIISLVIIGSMFTTLPLRGFYSNSLTFRYLLNIIGWVHFWLPGVFKDLPLTRVNASLWTIPFELECYLVIVVLWTLGIVKRPALLLLATVLLQLVVFMHDGPHGQALANDVNVSGRVLISCFLFGVLMYQFKDRIVLNKALFLLSAIISILLLMSPVASYFVALPAAYLTVFLGMTDPAKAPIILDGDYSYGIYLYAFPIQQAVTSVLPLAYRQWYINAPVSLVIVSAFAAFSWHFIEKPILHRRKHVAGLVERALARLGGKRRLPPDPADVGVMDLKSGI